MTTTRITRFDRFVLDLDGTSYGDEHERQRWYEGMAVAATVQWYLLPYVCAGCLLAWGRPVAPTVLLVTLALYGPLMLTRFYLHRFNVRVDHVMGTRRGMVSMAVVMVPYLVVFLDLMRLYTAPSTFVGALCGAPVGLVIGFAALAAKARKRRAWEARADEVA